MSDPLPFGDEVWGLLLLSCNSIIISLFCCIPLLTFLFFIRYVDRNPSIAALVLDSAFTDLTTVAHHFVDRLRETGIRAPNLLVC